MKDKKFKRLVEKSLIDYDKLELAMQRACDEQADLIKRVAEKGETKNEQY